LNSLEEKITAHYGTIYLISFTKKDLEQRNNLEELLLNGPTWTDEEYENFLEARKHLNEFRA